MYSSVFKDWEKITEKYEANFLRSVFTKTFNLRKGGYVATASISTPPTSWCSLPEINIWVTRKNVTVFQIISSSPVDANNRVLNFLLEEELS